MAMSGKHTPGSRPYPHLVNDDWEDSVCTLQHVLKSCLKAVCIILHGSLRLAPIRAHHLKTLLFEFKQAMAASLGQHTRAITVV